MMLRVWHGWHSVGTDGTNPDSAWHGWDGRQRRPWVAIEPFGDDGGAAHQLAFRVRVEDRVAFFTGVPEDSGARRAVDRSFKLLSWLKLVFSRSVVAG